MISPFQNKSFVYSNSEGFVTKNHLIKKIWDKPVFSFSYDELYCNSNSCSRSINNNDIILTNIEIDEVFSFIDSDFVYHSSGVYANGLFTFDGRSNELDTTIKNQPDITAANEVWRWDFLSNTWINTNPAVPKYITKFQAQAIMRTTFLEDGITSILTAAKTGLKAAQNATAALPENDPRRIQADLALLAFEQSNDFYRESSFIELFEAAVWPDKTEEERDFLINQLFIKGSKIT